ncbi:MAG: DUF262 domain-containing protein, partial [Spirulinaceae cyanobacterium]
MPQTPINAEEKVLADIFCNKYEFHIPSYQRPYSWTEEQAGYLFNDLHDAFISQNEQEEYFLGSIVLIKETNCPKADVIDGQQRLTTLTILLSCLRSKLTAEKQESISIYLIEKGNEFTGIRPQARLNLRKKDQEFFLKYIQKTNLENFLGLDVANDNIFKNEAQTNIHKNCGLFIREINQHFSAIDDVTEFIKFILTKCYLVVVSSANEASAFRIFSVMNSRGLDLQVSDILKAEITGKIPENEQDQYTEKWEESEELLGREKFNELFSHIRMIYTKSKLSESIISKYRKKILPRIESKDFMDNYFNKYVSTFDIVKNVQFSATENAEEINDYLYWLNKINFSEWIPPAILFITNQNDSQKVLDFLKKLERLTTYLFLEGFYNTKRIRRYTKIIEQIEKGQSLEALQLSQEEEEQFFNRLNGDIYLMSSNKKKYVILRLDRIKADGAANYQHKLLTIEHIMPQTVREGSAWAEIPDEEHQKWVHKIANLVPLNRSRNSQASNWDFHRKREA